MNIMYGVIAAVGVGGVAFMYANRQPADVYAMPVNQVYAQLANVDFGSDIDETNGHGQQVVRTARGNGSNQLTWTESGGRINFECRLDLQPWEDDEAKTQITVTCQGPASVSQGPTSGMAHKYRRSRVIERIDATLTGREYSPARAGATSDEWPGDGVDGSIGAAADSMGELGRAVERRVNERENGGPPEEARLRAMMRQEEVRQMQQAASQNQQSEDAH